MLSLPHVVLQVASRPIALVQAVDALVDRFAEVAQRAFALLDVADPVAERAANVTVRAGEVTEDVAATVASVQPLVAAVSSIDPQALIALVESIPAVLERLASQVEHLDQTVAEVGALLSGIPGAARLAKRGDRLTAR